MSIFPVHGNECRVAFPGWGNVLDERNHTFTILVFLASDHDEWCERQEGAYGLVLSIGLKTGTDMSILALLPQCHSKPDVMTVLDNYDMLRKPYHQCTHCKHIYLAAEDNSGCFSSICIGAPNGQFAKCSGSQCSCGSCAAFSAIDKRIMSVRDRNVSVPIAATLIGVRIAMGFPLFDTLALFVVCSASRVLWGQRMYSSRARRFARNAMKTITDIDVSALNALLWETSLHE